MRVSPTLRTCRFFFSASRHHLHLHSFPTRRSSDLSSSSIRGESAIRAGWGTARFVSCSAVTVRSCAARDEPCRDRKSTRLNSSHQIISYAVFCLKKKKKKTIKNTLDKVHKRNNSLI